MFSGFSGSKLKPQLKMAVSRFQIASNKKSALIKQQMRDIAVMLAEDPPREEKARIRAEALIREDNCVEAYEILQLECELLAERIRLLQSVRECPPDLVSCISTLIWACNRVDISELALIKKQFRSKYGKKFEENAMNNVGGVLNERVVSKLSVQPPAAYLVQVYLEKIADQYEVDWKPKVSLSADRMSEPMTAPVGYSVQVAGASGLGEVTTGQMSTDQEIGLPTKTDNLSVPPPVVVTAEPYIPSPQVTPQIKSPHKKTDFEEVDIFIPAVPSVPTAPSSTNEQSTNDEKRDDDGSLPPPAPHNGTGKQSASYRDLAARFQQLKK